MATMQQHRQQTNTWSTIFPTEQVTQQQSALFVKKLLAVAISNITYLRTIFPEHAFGDRCLEDLSLKILRDDSACPGACQVIQWVKGCFDALDKKYLKTIVIGIYEDSKDHSTVVETYTFKFGYNKEEGVTIFRNGSKLAGAYTEAETRKATIKLLRTIVVLTQTLKPLPDDVMMTMKLYYYDDVTPSDYEPPGFQATTADDFSFKEKPMNIRVGDVDTPFHTVKLRIKTDCQQFAFCEDEVAKEVEGGAHHLEGGEAMEVDNTHTTGQRRPRGLCSLPGKDTSAIGESQGCADEPSAISSAVSDIDPPHHAHKKKKDDVADAFSVIEDDSSMKEKEREKEGEGEREEEGEREGEEERERGGKSGMEKVKRNGVSMERGTKEEQGENIVRCPCGCNEDDGLMVLCAVCDVWQHAICFALLSENEVPETHICVQCSQSAGNQTQAKCTDPFLWLLNPATLQAACLWRRALIASLEFNRIVPPTFARRLGVAVSVAQGLINRLEKEGYVRVPMKNKRLGKIVNKDRIRNDGIRKYFDMVRKEAKAQMAKRTESASKKPEQNGDQGESVADITSGASSLTISHNPPPSGVAAPPQVTAIQQDDEESGMRRSPRIVAKRVRAAVDQSIEFELSNSQDMDSFSETNENRRKRRKASIASRSILV